MKKALLAAVVISSLLSINSFSQSATLDVSGGYCFALAPTSEAVERNVTQNASFPFYATTYIKVKRMSYGKGGNVAFNFNWYSKKNIGFGIKLNMLICAPFSYTTTLSLLNASKEYYDYTNKAFSIQFIPHLCFRHDFKVVSPVLEMGMIIGMAQIEQHYQITSSVYSNVIRTTVRDYGNALLGFYSSVGMSFNVSRVVKINLALNCVAGSYSPSKWKRTSFTVDGLDQMNALPLSFKEGEYVSEVDLQATQSSSVPAQDVKYSAAFSNIGITAGICFMIAKKQKKVVEKEDPNVVHPF